MTKVVCFDIVQILNEMIHPLDSRDLLPQGSRSGRGYVRSAGLLLSKISAIIG